METQTVKPNDPTYTITVDGYSHEHGLTLIDANMLIDLLEDQFPGARIKHIEER